MLADHGVKEVTLLGQNVNSYGKTFDEAYDFADLLSDINKIEGIERIRFMTSHPKDITDKLLETMAVSDKVCKSLHLPVQAGNNRVLKVMNRHYTREDYLKIVEKARALMPDITLSTDLIVGFPGETLEEFEDTLDLIKRVRYDSAFTFIYSKRTGTPAATMIDTTDDGEKHRRFSILLELVNGIVKEKIKTYDGKTLSVLVENTSKNSDDELMGRTEGGVTVNFKGDQSLIGTMVKIKVTKPRNFSVYGELV